MDNANNNNNNRENRQDNSSSWITGAAIGAAGLLTGTALYFMTRSKTEAPKKEAHKTSAKPVASPPTPAASPSNNSALNTAVSVATYLGDMLNRIETSRGGPSSSFSRMSIREIPENPVISNLNSLLADIYVRYIKLKQFDIHYRVFDRIFQDLHKKMKEVDPYYEKYSSTVQFAGSHFDKLRIKKPDEFDMDIVIALPLNIKIDPLNPTGSDIIFEPKSAGFVQLRMGVQFQRLPMRDKEEWLINRAAYEWKDDSNYLLRDKFTNWFKSVVYKALNQFEKNIDGRPIYNVDGIQYVIDTSESGPAVTLKMKSKLGFKMDVDLVPCLKFPEDRWPIAKSYRHIPRNCKKDYWMVVPKPNKGSSSDHDKKRSWRLALHNQERELMYNSNNMKHAIKLMKLLRDTQNMHHIASYYIKTLFFWEIVERDDKQFWWKSNPAELFKLMVGKFHKALVDGKIPYFWEKNNNLIGAVKRNILDGYAAKLVPLLAVLEQPSQYKLVAKYLLPPNEFDDYNRKFLHI